MKKILTYGLILILSLSFCSPITSKANCAMKLGIFSEFADGFKEGWSGKKSHQRKSTRNSANLTVIQN